jgi:UDP-glucose 4-epimerase
MVMDNNNILVIGAAGYIGSHFCRYAQENGYVVTALDNISTGHRAAVRGFDFQHLDIKDPFAIRDFLSSRHFRAIFHFAASCLVGESVTNPSKYYRNNAVAAYNLLDAMKVTGHDRLIFSSTCAVYGEPDILPISEDAPKMPISPYGKSKLAIEWMLEDYRDAYGLRFAALRYFNAAGCEPIWGLGEDHDPETHLIPNVVKYALGLQKELIIFGSDYPTPDGSCIRDYIHVTDLAQAHLIAMQRLERQASLQLNLGTGEGVSNFQIIEAVEKVTREEISPFIGPRRPGDPPELYADPSLAQKVLEWKPTRSAPDKIVRDVVEWFRSRPQGYEDY